MSAPDVEKIIGDYLRDEMAQRVGGNTPSSVEDPWLRLTLIDDEPVDGGRPNHAFANYLQIDCYSGRAGTRATARALAVQVRDLLAVAHEQTFVGGVVSGAETRMSRQPDTQFEPQMERYIVTATVWMHS